MTVSRRVFCLAGAASAVASPLTATGAGEAGSAPLTLTSLITFDRPAARRLGLLCVDALGLSAATALVREQEQRVARLERRFPPAALICADYRAGDTIDIHGLRLTRLEAAVLIASHFDGRERPGFS